MTVERKPVAFGDLRNWLQALDGAGELQTIDAEVDWNIELGTVARLAQGPGNGPALLFNKIRDYGENARCQQVFAGALSSYRRIAMMFGLPPDTHPRELVKLGRTVLTGAIPPKIVKTGPVKENIVKGDDVDLNDFPAPQWNRADGGRYILTYGGVVTKDPNTDVMNVGVYRGMVAGKNMIPMLTWRAQHIGQHATAWQQLGHKEMPIAVAIGWEPSLDFVGGAPVPKNLCEYDVIGAIRGAPVELVKCETVDLYVPASAEIVIEGFMSFDPATFLPEGPYAEFTGYIAGDRSPKSAIRVTCITHRKNPILRGTIEGTMPGSYSENSVTSSVMRAATAWNVLDRAGVPGITDVWCPPVQAGVNVVVQVKQSYRGVAKQVANALWGSFGGACALQARHRGRRRHRHSRLRRGRLGDRVPRQCRRGRHRHHALDLRRRPRSVGAQARPQRRAIRHRQMASRADRRHHQSRLRPGPRSRRRPLPADGAAGAEGYRRGDEAMGGTRLR